MYTRWLALGLLTALLLTPSAQAEILIGNLVGSNDNLATTAIGLHTKVAGFTLPDTAYEIDSVTLRLDIGNVDTVLRLQIFDDNGGSPGTSIQNFDSPTVSATGTDSFVFTPTSTVTLQANETYWVVPGLSSGSIYSWSASDPGITPTGIATNAGYLYNGDSSSTLNTYQIDATIASAVPEPSTFVLFGTVVGCGLVVQGVRHYRARRMQGESHDDDEIV